MIANVVIVPLAAALTGPWCCPVLIGITAACIGAWFLAARLLGHWRRT